MKHYISAIAAILLGLAAAADPYTIPLSYNRSSGFLFTKSYIDTQGKGAFELLVDTQFEYLQAYSTNCVSNQTNLMGRRLQDTNVGPCPGDQKVDVTGKVATKMNHPAEIQWIQPIMTYFMTGNFYPVTFCPDVAAAGNCRQMSGLMVYDLDHSDSTFKYPYEGFFGLAPQPANDQYQNNNLRQLLEGQNDFVFSIFISNSEDEISDAVIEIGSYDVAKYGKINNEENNGQIKWLNDRQNDYYWSVSMSNAYLYDGDEKEPILGKGPHSVIFSTQQKDISTDIDDFERIVNNLGRHGVMLQTLDNYFRCTDEFLKGLPDLWLEFQDTVTNELITMKLPWQGYVERMKDQNELCQLRITPQTMNWQIGTWARRQIYTVYKKNGAGNLQMGLIDSIQKEKSGRGDMAKYVRIIIIFACTLAGLFIVFTLACCAKNYFERNAKKEVVFNHQQNTPTDEQKEKLYNMNATQDETLDQEDGPTKQ